MKEITLENLLDEKGLTFEKLQILIKIGDAGSVYDAAGKDTVTQSNYSHQMKVLETFFGVKLMNREGQGVQLTEAGEKLYDYASEFLETLAEFKTVHTSTQKTFSIHSGLTFFDWFLLPRINKLQALHPDWKYQLTPRSTDTILRNVATMKCDIGILKRKNLTQRNIESLPLKDINFALYLPVKGVKGKTGRPKSFLDAIEGTSAKPWEGYDFALPEGGKFRRQFDEINEAQNLNISVGLSCRGFTQAKEALISGGYAAILPTAKHGEPVGIPVQEITGGWIDSLSFPMAIIWNKRMESIKPEIRKLAMDIQGLMKEG